MLNQLTLVFFLFFSVGALANDHRVIVAPHAPGGPSDIIARALIADDPRYSVLYKPGGLGVVAAHHAVTSTEQLIVLTTSQLFVSNTFDPALTQYSTSQFTNLEVIEVPAALVCGKHTNFKSLNNMLASPGPIKFGYAGEGSMEHQNTQIFLKKSGIKNYILVPFAQGGTATLVSVLGGHIDCWFANLPTLIQNSAVDRVDVIFLTHSASDSSRPSWVSIFGEPFPLRHFMTVSYKSGDSIKIHYDRLNFYKTLSARGFIQPREGRLDETTLARIVDKNKTMVKEFFSTQKLH